MTAQVSADASMKPEVDLDAAGTRGDVGRAIAPTEHRIEIPPHPMRLVVLGSIVFLSAVTAVPVVVGGGNGWLAMLIFVTGYGTYGIFAFRRLRAAQICLLAVKRLMVGDTDGADTLLSLVPRSALERGSIGRSVYLQRALIALHAGEARDAVKLATIAVELPFGRSTRSEEAEQIVQALAMRALGSAALGDEASVGADATSVEQHPTASVSAVARAALARAVVLARRSDRAALAVFLGQSHARLFEALQPRERVLLQALRRLAFSPRTSAYRAPLRRYPETDPGRLAHWIARFAPGAEQFVPESVSNSDVDGTPRPSAAEKKTPHTHDARTTAHRARASGGWLKTIVGWVSIVAALAWIGFALRPGVTAAAPSPFSFAAIAVPTAILAALYAFASVSGWREKRCGRELEAALHAAVRGDDARAAEKLQHLTASSLNSIAATAHLALSGIAYRRADWAAMVTQCDHGIDRVTSNASARALASDHVAPQLIAQRTIALAALGRQDESDAEIAALPKAFPTYSYVDRTTLRVRLFASVRNGDLEKAAEVASRRALDMGLGHYEEVLAELVIAATRGTAAEELERMRAELAHDESLRSWIDSVAPGLRERAQIQCADEGA